MTSTALFFRLFSDENKAKVLSEAISGYGAAEPSPSVYSVNLNALGRVPSSPFSYYVSDHVRELFQRLPPVQINGIRIVEGLNTTDNDRFLRLGWESSASDIGRHRKWVPLAKGGEYALYYSDLHLLINWENDGRTLKDLVSARYGSESKRIYGQSFYFVSGITYSQRTQRGLSFRCLPRNSIFNVKGPGVFAPVDQLPVFLAVLNSKWFKALVELQTSFGSYNVGYLQKTPFPNLSPDTRATLEQLASAEVAMKRDMAKMVETDHGFKVPIVIPENGKSITECAGNLRAKSENFRQESELTVDAIDEIVGSAYGLTDQDFQVSGSALSDVTFSESIVSSATDVEDLEDEFLISGEHENAESFVLTFDLLHYCIGSVLGRWDIRIALDQSLAPKLQGPFEPLPVCSPGMLVGSDGLPARRGEIVSEEWLRARPDVISLPSDGSVVQPTIPDADYPLRIDWDGILVDDDGHSDDIVGRTRDVLTLLWGERADAIEEEACQILGVRDLRSYYRDPKRFWDFHVKRYSKSRRKAPIYWLLQSSKRSYGIWLYYHRLDSDTLFKAIRYVSDRLQLEQARLDETIRDRPNTGGDPSVVRALEKRIETSEIFITEVTAFRVELQRVADLGLTVDHDDGVLLSIAPLHNIVPWAPAKAAWNELVAGKYGWSGIGQQMRTRGLVKESGRG